MRLAAVASSPLPARHPACALCDLCRPDAPHPLRQCEVVSARRRLRRGEALYRSGDAFTSLYAVRAGFLKSRVPIEDGRDQVTGFHMAGDVLGAEGIGSGAHTCDMVALEDSELCVIPYARLEGHGVQRRLHQVMSRELVRDQVVMLLLGSMRAEERLAAFLLGLSRRLAARGYSGTEFHLRTTRDEIGSYLGLSLETVSRLFSQFHAEGLVTVRHRHVRIHDLAALGALAARAVP
jgi:CRP/FNR family transcriptional regulator